MVGTGVLHKAQALAGGIDLMGEVPPTSLSQFGGDGFSIADFDDLLDAAVNDGDDVVITLDEAAGDEIRLVGVNEEDLSSDDFMITGV